MLITYFAHMAEETPPLPPPTPVVVASADDKPKKRRAKFAVYKKPAEPKKRTRAKKAQEIVIPIHEIPEAIKGKVPVKKVTSGEFTATLEGCSMRATGGLGVSGEMQSTLQGVEMNAYAKLYIKDDAVAIYTGIPELVEEIEV